MIVVPVQNARNLKLLNILKLKSQRASSETNALCNPHQVAQPRPLK